jgi:hypothetical protein
MRIPTILWALFMFMEQATSEAQVTSSLCSWYPIHFHFWSVPIYIQWLFPVQWRWIALGGKKRISCNRALADVVEGHAKNPPVSNDVRLACGVIIALELNKH